MLSAALLQKTNDILQAVRVSICYCLVDKRYFSKKFIDRPKYNSIGADINHIPHVVTLRGCIAKRTILYQNLYFGIYSIYIYICNYVTF